MARLSEDHAARLIDRLTHVSPDEPAQDDDAERVREALGALAASGDLGTLLGKRLGGYLNRPVRCTSGASPERLANRTTYAAKAQPEVWLSMDTMLAAAVADAMIGGEGDPARTGAGDRATRIAAHAASDLLAAVAAALGAPVPAGVEFEPAQASLGPPVGGGSMIVGSQEYGWLTGVRSMSAQRVPDTRMDAARRLEPALDRVDRHTVVKRGTIGEALEAARAAFERAIGMGVTFEGIRDERETRASLRAGDLNIAVPAWQGTAVLSLDEATASLLVAALTGLGDDTLAGTVGRVGIEALATEVLQTFVAVLSGDEVSTGRRPLALTDAAILAAAPHDAIQHDIAIAGRSGTLRWLVPSALASRRV